MLIGLLTGCGGDDAPVDPTPDADPGPCRTIATQLGSEPPTYVTFHRVSATLRSEVRSSPTDIWSFGQVYYDSVASFIAEASAVGLITAVDRDFDDGTIQSHEVYRRDDDGRLIGIDLHIEDIDDTDGVTTFDSHDALGRPLTGTSTWTEDIITCQAIAHTLSYDDDARTVTEAVTAGVDQGGQPCDGTRVTRRRYDENMILLATEYWNNTTEPDGAADSITNYAIEETGTVCTL